MDLNDNIRSIIEIENRCRSLLDSEFDVLREFDRQDLHDYLGSLFPDIPPNLVDKLYNEMF